jgi:hypothetical protein
LELVQSREGIDFFAGEAAQLFDGTHSEFWLCTREINHNKYNHLDLEIIHKNGKKNHWTV